MSKGHLIRIIEHFQSLLRKSGFDPDEATFLELPGRPKVYFEISMLCLYLVMTLKGIKTFRGLWRYITDWENRYVAKACGFDKLPSRETVRTRIQSMQPLLERAIEHVGRYLIDTGIVDSRHVAVDARMFEALGPKWHMGNREQNRIPEKLRGVDKDSTWKKSKYRGWVQGYGLSIVCIATPGQLPLPIMARAHANSACEGKIFKNMIYWLPSSVRFVLGDLGYDDKELFERIERWDENGHLCRRFIVPIEMETLGETTPPERRRRAKYANSTRGRKLYSRRMPSVEWIFGRIIETYEEEKAWFKGKHYVFPSLLLLVLAYQTLVDYNVMQGLKEISSVKPLLQCI